jgi:hypothetical protein
LAKYNLTFNIFSHIKKFKVYFSPYLFIGFVVLLATCSSHHDYPFVDAYLTKAVDYGGDTIWDRYVEVFNINGLAMIPAVKMNGNEVEMDQYDYIQCIYNDTFRFSTNQQYELTVDHYYGQASAKIWMPGDFSMIGPGPTYIYNRDSVLYVTWHKSPGATSYWFSVDLDYDFEDSLGEWDSYEFYHDTILKDTFVRYAPNRFFPGNVATILEGEAEAGSWAMDGPNRWVQGTKGNIRGQGQGYFSATYQPMELDFYVGAPPKIPKLKNSGKVWDRLKAKAKEISKTNN